MSEPATPRLAISASTPRAHARCTRAAEALLARMPPDDAARLARTCVVFVIDEEQHRGFAQRLGEAGDVTGQLAAERIRQRAAKDEILHVIVISLRNVTNVEWLLGHEAGHVLLGHCTSSAAAASLSDEQLDALEREADAFAEQYGSGW